MYSDFKIDSIFPKAVLTSNINREWTEREQFLFNYHKDFTHNNTGNITSNDRYVLNAKEVKSIVEFIGAGIQHYVNTVICPKNLTEFYITQSWLNYTKKGQFHHTHAHPNSILSGVLYIDANEGKDKISFEKTGYKQISIPTENFNAYNSDAWWFPVKTGDLIIFPSDTIHKVEIKEGDNVRTSLAFNVFVRGYLGEEEKLTALHL